MGIAFPFWSKRLEAKNWKIRLHVAEVVGSILLCALAPTIYVTVSDYKFGRFPPLLSLPTKTVVFYTIILPLTVILVVGTNLFVLSLFKIHKVRVKKIFKI